MGLFKPDLYRSFGIGFAIGAMVLFASIGGEARAEIVSKVIPAISATN